MKKSWKDRIDNANSFEQLKSTVADMLHRNSFDVNEVK